MLTCCSSFLPHTLCDENTPRETSAAVVVIIMMMSRARYAVGWHYDAATMVRTSATRNGPWLAMAGGWAGQGHIMDDD